MSNLLQTVGLSEETIKEVKVEPSTGSFLWESGAYEVEVKQVAIFKTDSKAVMMKIDLFDPKEEKAFTEYVNTSYISKDEKKEVTENKGGAKIFKALFSAIKLEPAQATTSNEEIDAYGKKVQADVVTNAAGRKCIALVREVNDPNKEQYQDYNVIEGFADIEGNIGGSDEPMKKWLDKIEKAPILTKKAKKKAGVTVASSATAQAEAKSLLD